jgi:hypothetical protein
MDTEEENFDHSAIPKNRDHFERHRIAGVFFDAVLRETMDAELTSDDHFSSDETMIESMASIYSFRPIDDNNDNQQTGNSIKSCNPNVDFHEKKRSNKTQHSRTVPKTRAISEGKYLARLRMQSRQKTPEYSASQRFRKKVERCFSWIKMVGDSPPKPLVRPLQTGTAIHNQCRRVQLSHDE